MANIKPQLPIFTVTQLNTMIKAALEEALQPRLMLRGEISDFKQHTSGHCYFLLKDAGGQIPCTMWASHFRQVKFRCENGLAVLAAGHIDVYLPGGKYQFYCDKLEPAGMGALQLAFEQMRRRLEAEGLFDPARKKPLPRYPMNIGIVTSFSGAALHDIADSIQTRWPCARLYVFDTPVQGEGAAPCIAAAIAKANRLRKQLGLELLIVGRGGGSMEDLWAFNEEAVARAIYASKLPVISAVGHEVDVTIADLVADKRVSTPTRAGVEAVPDWREELQKIQSLARRLQNTIRSQVQNSRNLLAAVLASRVFRLPLGPVQIAAQRIDELANRLMHSVQRHLAYRKDQLERMRAMVQRIEPIRLLAKNQLAIQTLEGHSRTAMLQILNKNQLQLAALENRLQALNPRSVLKRGYSITINQRTGCLVTDIKQVLINDPLTTELAAGRIISRVEETKNKPLE
ncbi:MAG TPA: exodeoxyribonuclease VII large subunit [Anaerohalosphaeraceae bacterium]|nr:exodeoxyribonuclease VII large subunit [Anaerohalosphaeraceae bacterium]